MRRAHGDERAPAIHLNIGTSDGSVGRDVERAGPGELHLGHGDAPVRGDSPEGKGSPHETGG